MGKWWVTDVQRKAERPLISADANRPWRFTAQPQVPLGSANGILKRNDVLVAVGKKKRGCFIHSVVTTNVL